MSDETRRGNWNRSWSWRVRRWQWCRFWSGSEKPLIGGPLRPRGKSSGMRIQRTTSRHASSALGRRGHGIPMVHTFDESLSSMGRHRRGTRRAWRRVFCSSSSGRDIDPQRCGAPCRRYTLYGSWDGYRRYDGNASGASPVRRWLPRGTALTQAPMFCRSWPRPARLRRTGLSSPPPSSPSAASHAWGKSRLSGAPACGRRRWLSGASNGTRAGFPVTSAVLRANGPTDCGASFLDRTSWSTEPPSSKRVWPDCSKAALTRLTAGTRGVARGLPSSDSVASPGATYAGGDAWPVCAWRTSTQRHQRTSPSTRAHACRGQRVRGSSGSPPTKPSSGRHRSWFFFGNTPQITAMLSSWYPPHLPFEDIIFLDLHVLNLHEPRYCTHFKPTKSATYIPWSSNTPRGTKLGWRRGEEVRFLRTDSHERYFLAAVKRMNGACHKLGYPKTLCSSLPVSWSEKDRYMTRNSKTKDRRVGSFLEFFRIHVWRVPYEACIPLKYGDPIHRLNQQIKQSIPGIKLFAVNRPQPNLRKRWHRALVKTLNDRGNVQTAADSLSMDASLLLNCRAAAENGNCSQSKRRRVA